MDTSPNTRLSAEDVIHACSLMIQDKNIVAGIGNAMVSPMVSIIMGEEAEENRQKISDTYYSCWSSKAEQVRFLKGAYRAHALEAAACEAVSQAPTQDRNSGVTNYIDNKSLVIAWYWDIMDDQFDDYFRSVKQPFGLPLNCTCDKVVFIFCRQMLPSDQITTQQRLEHVINWANETSTPLVVLSNQSSGSSLPGRRVSENYHLAATILMLMNTQSATEDADASLAKELRFRLKQEQIWTAGYNIVAKPYKDIVNVSLLRIIEKGTALDNNQSNYTPFPHGPAQEYTEWIDEVFAEVLEKLCPAESERVFLEDLPWTADMDALYQSTLEPVSSGFSLKKLFKKKPGSWDQAIYSLGNFWTECVRVYYHEPIRQFLESSEGYRAVTEAMRNRLVTRFSLNEMAQFGNEATELHTSKRYQNPEKSYDTPSVGEDLSNYLHKCACLDVKNSIYGTLSIMLANVMTEMCRKTQSFKPLMKTVSTSFSNVGYNKHIMNSYGDHMKHLLDKHDNIFRQKFLPCDNESDLFAQIQQIFVDMCNLDTDKRYFASLQDHIHFQIDSGNRTAGHDAISECFEKKVQDLGRFSSYSKREGFLYCIMNDSMTGLLENIQTDDIGKQFVINRSDRIERVYLYPIDEHTIQYSN